MITHDGKEYSPFSPLPQNSALQKRSLRRKANQLLMETPLVKVVEIGERITGYALDWPNGADRLPRFIRASSDGCQPAETMDMLTLIDLYQEGQGD